MFDADKSFETKSSLRKTIALTLERARNTQKTTNAFISICDDLALARAEELEKTTINKRLFGLPIAVKDNINVLGTKTTCGSKLLASYISSYTSTAVSRLLEDGAIIIGKTNMDEFAMGSSSESSYFGPVRNPRDLSKVAGGSSGGSAATVATGTVSVALGSDTGGSIRQPASFCGVVGFKPSYGAISRFGLVAHGSSLDQIGPIANSAKLCAQVFESMVGLDVRDQSTIEIAKTTPKKSFSGLRVAFVANSWVDACDDRIKNMMRELRTKFSKLGATIIENIDPGFKYALPCYYIISSAEASSNLSRFDGIRYGNESIASLRERKVFAPFRSSGFGAEVKRRIMLGTYVLSEGYAEQYYRKAISARQKIISQTQVMFDSADVFITPVSASPAFSIGEKTADPVAMYQSDTFTTYANLAKIPAIALPFRDDKSEQSPIGFQIHAPYRADRALLSVAEHYEAQHDR